MSQRTHLHIADVLQALDGNDSDAEELFGEDDDDDCVPKTSRD